MVFLEIFYLEHAVEQLIKFHVLAAPRQSAENFCGKGKEMFSPRLGASFAIQSRWLFKFFN